MFVLSLLGGKIEYRGQKKRIIEEEEEEEEEDMIFRYGQSEDASSR